MRRCCRELGWPCQPRTCGTTRCYLNHSPDCRSQLPSMGQQRGSARVDGGGHGVYPVACERT
eukprot:scaffold789_cov75-Phaeocystis_antarctica.AAC.1